MAVVLPIHSHIGFSNPQENDYGSHCHGEDDGAGEGRINDNELSPNAFANCNGDNKGADDDYVSRSSKLNQDENIGDNDNEMDDGETSVESESNLYALPSILPGQNSADILDQSNIGDDCTNEHETNNAPESTANYWSMNSDVPDEKCEENDTAVEDNSAFISSLMAVDLDSTKNYESDDQVDPRGSNLANVVDAMLMDESDNVKKEDDMQLKFDLTPKTEANEALTLIATLADFGTESTTSHKNQRTASSVSTRESDEERKKRQHIANSSSSSSLSSQHEQEQELTAAAEQEKLEQEMAAEEEFSTAPLYGGLGNLGNTCYMASALQFLCGLDSFPADLKCRIPPEKNDKEDGKSCDSNSLSLRDALIDVMDRLSNGETVRPDNLKRCIDSRTGLFLGYHQQDSHEFLTTLLDMIDEDYKIKPKAEETAEAVTSLATNEESKSENDYSENDENDSNQNEFRNGSFKVVNYESCEILAGDSGLELPALYQNLADEKQCNCDENDCDSNADPSDEESLESAQKRQKIFEEKTAIEPKTESIAVGVIESGEGSNVTGSMQRSKSFTNYKFSDIESLLHDKSDSSRGKIESDNSENSLVVTTDLSSSSVAKQDEPKCKLAGGRMSTSGVELTRFVEESGMDENVHSTGASVDKVTPQQQIVEAGHHEAEEEEESEETSSSPVSSNFTTKVRVCLTCDSCKFRRSHIETYFHLSLDISSGCNNDNNDDVCSLGDLGCPSSRSIEDGLRKFFAPEKREIKCEKCFHTSALQTSEITQLPRNMLFHLKRFIVDVSPDYSSISYRKDQSAVAFNERMELERTSDDNENRGTSNELRIVNDDDERTFRDFLAMDCSYPTGAAYEIRSVVNHIGSSASCGHYTADAKRRTQRTTGEAQTVDGTVGFGETFGEEPSNNSDEETKCDNDDREWIRFNDSYVSKISSKEAVENASQTAYMIMYELVH